MAWKAFFLNSTSKEIIFQIVLHIVLFLFFSFDSHKPQIEEFKVMAFISYALGALIINYLLLPRFFLQKEISTIFCVRDFYCRRDY